MFASVLNVAFFLVFEFLPFQVYDLPWRRMGLRGNKPNTEQKQQSDSNRLFSLCCCFSTLTKKCGLSTRIEEMSQFKKMITKIASAVFDMQVYVWELHSLLNLNCIVMAHSSPGLQRPQCFHNFAILYSPWGKNVAPAPVYQNWHVLSRLPGDIEFWAKWHYSPFTKNDEIIVGQAFHKKWDQTLFIELKKTNKKEFQNSLVKPKHMSGIHFKIITG